MLGRISPILSSLVASVSFAQPLIDIGSKQDQEIHDKVFEKEIYQRFKDDPQSILELKVLMDNHELSNSEVPLIIRPDQPTSRDITLLYESLREAASVDNEKGIRKELIDNIINVSGSFEGDFAKSIPVLGIASWTYDMFTAKNLEETRFTAQQSLNELDIFAYDYLPTLTTRLLESREDFSLMHSIFDSGENVPLPTESTEALLGRDPDLKYTLGVLEPFIRKRNLSFGEEKQLLRKGLEGIEFVTKGVQEIKDEPMSILKKYESYNLDERERETRRIETAFREAQAGISIVSSFIGLADQKTARVVQNVGSSTYNIGLGIARLATREQFSLQPLALIAGGFGGLGSIFGGDPDQARFEAIMKELYKIEREVQETKKEVVEARKDIAWLHRDDNRNFNKVQLTLLDMQQQSAEDFAATSNSLNEIKTELGRLERLAILGLQTQGEIYKLVKEKTQWDLKQVKDDSDIWITTNYPPRESKEFREVEATMSGLTRYATEATWNFSINGGQFTLENIASPESPIEAPRDLNSITGLIPRIFSNRGIYTLLPEGGRAVPATKWRNPKETINAANLFLGISDRFWLKLWDQIEIPATGTVNMISYGRRIESTLSELEEEQRFLQDPRVLSAAYNAYNVAVERVIETARKDMIDQFPFNEAVKRDMVVRGKRVTIDPKAAALKNLPQQPAEATVNVNNRDGEFKFIVDIEPLPAEMWLAANSWGSLDANSTGNFYFEPSRKNNWYVKINQIITVEGQGTRMQLYSKELDLQEYAGKNNFLLEGQVSTWIGAWDHHHSAQFWKELEARWKGDITLTAKGLREDALESIGRMQEARQKCIEAGKETVKRRVGTKNEGEWQEFDTGRYKHQKEIDAWGKLIGERENFIKGINDYVCAVPYRQILKETAPVFAPVEAFEKRNNEFFKNQVGLAYSNYFTNLNDETGKNLSSEMTKALADLSVAEFGLDLVVSAAYPELKDIPARTYNRDQMVDMLRYTQVTGENKDRNLVEDFFDKTETYSIAAGEIGSEIYKRLNLVTYVPEVGVIGFFNSARPEIYVGLSSVRERISERIALDEKMKDAKLVLNKGN